MTICLCVISTEKAKHSTTRNFTLLNRLLLTMASLLINWKSVTFGQKSNLQRSSHLDFRQPP